MPNWTTGVGSPQISRIELSSRALRRYEFELDESNAAEADMTRTYVSQGQCCANFDCNKQNDDSLKPELMGLTYPFPE